MRAEPVLHAEEHGDSSAHSPNPIHVPASVRTPVCPGLRERQREERERERVTERETEK